MRRLRLYRLWSNPMILKLPYLKTKFSSIRRPRSMPKESVFALANSNWLTLPKKLSTITNSEWMLNLKIDNNWRQSLKSRIGTRRSSSSSVMRSFVTSLFQSRQFTEHHKATLCRFWWLWPYQVANSSCQISTETSYLNLWLKIVTKSLKSRPILGVLQRRTICMLPC